VRSSKLSTSKGSSKALKASRKAAAAAAEEDLDLDTYEEEYDYDEVNQHVGGSVEWKCKTAERKRAASSVVNVKYVAMSFIE